MTPSGAHAPQEWRLATSAAGEPPMKGTNRNDP